MKHILEGAAPYVFWDQMGNWTLLGGGHTYGQAPRQTDDDRTARNVVGCYNASDVETVIHSEMLALGTR